ARHVGDGDQLLELEDEGGTGHLPPQVRGADFHQPVGDLERGHLTPHREHRAGVLENAKSSQSDRFFPRDLELR
ncbi:unnamed protein product, partial [Ectocarpus sp. 8 AP-2014]